MVTLLITLPKHEQTTRCISAWAKKALKEAERKGLKIIELADKRACKKDFESMIKKHKPSFVFLNGHGGASVVTGHENEILVQAGMNEEILEGTITYALACQAAKILRECERRWSLNVQLPFTSLSYNYVAPAKRVDGTPVILSACWSVEDHGGGWEWAVFCARTLAHL